MCGLQSKLSEISDNSLGYYYIYYKYYDLYSNIKDDEFTLGDATLKYSKIFKSKINESCNKIKNKEYVLNLRADLEKYNFDKQGFPISGMTTDSHVGFSSNLADAKLVFDNADNSKNFLAVPKNEAKEMLKNIKRTKKFTDLGNGHRIEEVAPVGYGNDRTILAKYYFTIESIDTPIDQIIAFSQNQMGSKIYNETIHAKATKVEYLNRYTKEILATQTY